MADTVDVDVLHEDSLSLIVRLTCKSDGTSESNIAKVVKANLKSAAGIAPVALDIKEIRWSVSGFSSVDLRYNHTTPDHAWSCVGNGFDDRGTKDPRSAGGTGDLELTSNGAVSGARYDITIELVKQRT